MTEGQKRVGVLFNPSENDGVDYIKQNVARLIDYVLEQAPGREGAIAATELEGAAMWAVKAVVRARG